jgi:hypothetical protein
VLSGGAQPGTNVDTLKKKLPPIGQFGPAIALVIACAIFGATTDRFFSGENFSLILQQVMVVGVIAIGQTLIILTAGIDLSCGMIMALGSIVMTKFAADLGLPAPFAILCGIAVTAAFGLLKRSAGHAHQAAAVHRHAWHLQHRFRDHAAVFQLADRDRSAARDDRAGQHLRRRRNRGWRTALC